MIYYYDLLYIYVYVACKCFNFCFKYMYIYSILSAILSPSYKVPVCYSVTSLFRLVLPPTARPRVIKNGVFGFGVSVNLILMRPVSGEYTFKSKENKQTYNVILCKMQNRKNSERKEKSKNGVNCIFRQFRNRIKCFENFCFFLNVFNTLLA